MLYPLLSSKKGFSIILALGSIGVLLIIVIGMASVFLSEMRLSRLQYDSILSSTQAEGAFEYAMLKVRNHRDGFADNMLASSPDSVIFRGSSARTDKVAIDYTIESQSKVSKFIGGDGAYIIVPLFSGRCETSDELDASSCSPEIGNGMNLIKTIKLTTSLDPKNLSWSIVGMSGALNVSLAGSGNIYGGETGIMRLRTEDCLDGNGATIDCQNSLVAERLPYFYDKKGTTFDFLSATPGSEFSDTKVQDPYILIYSSGATADITLETDVPHTLPDMRITAQARKGEAVQAIRFEENKSRYYDALKYGVYNAE